MCIHGKQKQTKRTTTFFQYCNADSGILLCTDVAARGLDIPDVDWIVQFDPPDDPREYIHRVGRTARGEGGKGHALLILRPEELGFLRYLRQANVPLNEFEFSWSKVSDIQPQLEKLTSKNYFLNLSAKEAFKAYVRAYESHGLKHVSQLPHYSKSQIFVQKFNFDKTPTFSRVFHPKFFLTIFLVKSKLSTAKKTKTTTFSRVFHPQKIDNFLGKSKLNFWTKNEDFEYE